MDERTPDAPPARRRWPYVAVALVLVAVVVLILLADDTSGLYEIRR